MFQSFLVQPKSFFTQSGQQSIKMGWYPSLLSMESLLSLYFMPDLCIYVVFKGNFLSSGHYRHQKTSFDLDLWFPELSKYMCFCRRESCLTRPCWPGSWKGLVQLHTNTCSITELSPSCSPPTGWCVSSHVTYLSTHFCESGTSFSAMVRPPSGLLWIIQLTFLPESEAKNKW